MLPDSFSQALEIILYEADPKENLVILNKNISYVNKCLYDTKSEVNFKINFVRNTSSIFPFNTEYSNLCFSYKGKDALCGDTHRTEYIIPLATTTLDDIVANGISSPDILSLDVQGAAHQVIQGGLDENTLYVEVEIEFVELYAGQKSFGDVCTLLRKYGFEFFCFSSIRHVSNRRVPVGWQNRSRQVQGIAVFLRNRDW